MLALVLMLLAALAFVAMQAFVKLARTSGFSAAEVTVFRTTPGLPFLWWSLRRRGLGLRAVHPRNLQVRSFFGSIAMGTNFTAMRSLSLAQFSTLGLSQPIFVAVFSPLLLGERVRSHVVGAMLCAGAGAYVLLAPDADVQGVPMLPATLGIVSAIASAFAHIWVRKSTTRDPIERVVFHFAGWASAGALLFGLWDGGFRSLPQGLGALSALGLVLSMALFGTLGQVLMTRAYTLGEAAMVSSVGYVGVLISMFADWLVWSVRPGRDALFAAALMLAGGIWLMRGERRRARAS
jgi:drug/metabolite transporter (DMT)-like permease